MVVAGPALGMTSTSDMSAINADRVKIRVVGTKAAGLLYKILAC
jgi:hypothetical protein